MKWIKMYIAMVMFLLIGASTALAHNNVVVVPLGGAKGDAGADHVLDGKTFSSENGKGLTGTRPYAPVADTGATSSAFLGDDASYRLNIGVSVENRFPSGLDLGQGLYDKLTGLYWESNPPSSTANWENAITRCENKTTSFLGLTWSDWRLPTINELNSIIDRSQINPALPVDLNISLPLATDYWSSTPYAIGTTGWMINLGTGSTSIEPRANPHYNICVRGQFKVFIVIPLDEE